MGLFEKNKDIWETIQVLNRYRYRFVGQLQLHSLSWSFMQFLWFENELSTLQFSKSNQFTGNLPNIWLVSSHLRLFSSFFSEKNDKFETPPDIFIISHRPTSGDSNDTNDSNTTVTATYTVTVTSTSTLLTTTADVAPVRVTWRRYHRFISFHRFVGLTST